MRPSILIRGRNFYTCGVKRTQVRTHVTAYRDRVVINESGYVTHGVPPRGSGERWHTGFSGKQRSRIMRAAEFIVDFPSSFVTLTFPAGVYASAYGPAMQVYRPAGVDVISDQQARVMLRAWLRSCGIERYLWVAEVQPKRWANRAQRAVHFHLLVQVENSNSCPLEWREKWSELNGTASMIDVVECYGTPGHYLTKYVAKGSTLSPPMRIQGNGYGMDHKTSSLLKPLAALSADGVHVDEVCGMMEQAVNENGLEGNFYSGPHSSVYVYENLQRSTNEKCQIIWHLASDVVNSGGIVTKR